MKKMTIWLLILALLLCGCGGNSADTDGGGETTTTTQTPNPDVTVEFYTDIYVADSAMEQATDGAVLEFAPDLIDCYDVCAFAEGILLLSGEGDTVLTYLTPEGGAYSKTLEGRFLFQEELTFLAENRIAYYDPDSCSVIVLDAQLQEAERVAMPESMVSEPAVTADWSKIFYLTDSELRYIDVANGLDKFLKQIRFPSQDIAGLCFDDTVLECFTMSEEETTSLMISTQTGETLWSGDLLPKLYTFGESYFLTNYDGIIEEHIFGNRNEKASCLNVTDPVYWVSPRMQCAVTCNQTDEGVFLACYDLTTGYKTGAVTVAAEYQVERISGDLNSGGIWFLAYNLNNETSSLYFWNLSASETGETRSYISPYYTADEPDTEGLERIAQQAQTLGQKYGIRIRVYEDVRKVEPSDYTFEVEHRVHIYEQYLTQLETALDKYPEGFLRKLGTASDNGKVTISLVRAAYGDNGLGSLETADGVHFYNDGSVYIALAMGDRFAPTLYHELFHSIDTYVLNNSIAYDDWETLNPDGFRYDNDYVSNQFREDYQYLEEDRWFIDMYSMSYPKEDRARIMEYAMEEGNGEYFQSAHMQKKLTVLCKGIRTAFGLTKYSGILPWEQYLG